MALPLIVGASDDLEKNGYKIAQYSSQTNDGFGDTIVDVTMILRNKVGNEFVREISIKSLENISSDSDDGDKSIVIFDSPKDIKGTALLSHIKVTASDDQWLFLPKLKRVKRISSKNKSGPFVGSEFAFEDFSSFELRKYSYKYIGLEKLDGMLVDVIKRVPLYKNSGYTKQITYIDQKYKQVRKIAFYDRKGTLLKTLLLKDYRKYGKYWRAHRAEMSNHLTGKGTDMIYGDYKFNTGLINKDFEKGKLKAGGK